MKTGKILHFNITNLIRISKPVMSFVQPLYGIRGIDSAYHAARFVSLFQYVPEMLPTKDERAEVWHSFHTFIAQGFGDVEDHSTLLCSLLLGFGLDAYICVGNSGDGPHLWVMSRIFNDASKTYKIKFWESLTGQRYLQRNNFSLR